ncbi:peptidase domain-containing protein [Kalymmatonema gypsitolerans NIES-4073]|nr:peptidase domain-containing protein [Scytonema sp. NIES-4073]
MSNFDVGTLPSNGNPVIRNNVALTPTQPTDVFEFRIGSTSNINVALTGITNGDNANLKLYRDNGNGRFDAGDQEIGSSIRGGNNDDSINLADRAAGTYFAQVNRSTSSGNVTYDLALSTKDPSNLLPREVNLGNLSADVTRTGRVDNSDTSDVYHFSLGFFEGVNINLSGLSSDADLRVIADTNNNRIIDPSDTIVSSTRAGTAPESIRLDDAGSYFAQVYQFSGNTNYNLTFDHFTTPNQLLVA